MSIIQTIRERAAVIMIVIIAISLIAFILQDSFSGRGSGVTSTKIGEVNGEDIDFIDFRQAMEMQENQYKQAGMPVSEAFRQNIMEGVWNQFVSEKLLDKEAEKLGITVTAKELNDYLFGDNPPDDLRRQFTNPETGQYDAIAAQQAVAALRARKDEMAENFANRYLPALMKSRQQEKYSALLESAAYLPKWMIDKINSDNNAVASIQFVNIPYSTIADSLVMVTDDDIRKYINERPDQFKQEKSRTIVYTMFDASPSEQDSAQVLSDLQKLYDEFSTTSDMESFLNRVGSETPYYNGFVLKSKLSMEKADSLRNLQLNQVFGPYIDGNNYVLARMMEKRTMPDSVKCRHILISTQGGLSDDDAKKRADSIAQAIKGGADFKALVTQYTDDPGSKETGGEYDFTSLNFGNLAKEFAEAVFYGKAGDKKVVKTQFGYHYIEVMSQKNFEEAYRIAYLSKPIVSGIETETIASNAASQFAGDSRDYQSFMDNLKKQNLQEFTAPNIGENDFSIPGIGDARSLVRDIYAAKKGQVLDPVNVGDKYIVAVVVDVQEEGLISPSKARPSVEFVIKNQKKAELIKNKYSSSKTLEELAAAAGVEVLSVDSLNFASTFVQGAGSEPKVVGYAFNKENQDKVSPLIAGTTGVFAVKTNSIGAGSSSVVDSEQLKRGMIMQMRSSSTRSALEALRKEAKIKDLRAKFY
ncbi:MAG TPA: peptidylprolyl isomerase [Parasegetibacter sp.]